MILNIPDINTSLSQRLSWAVIDKVYYIDDTADISILDNDLNATTETYKNVPIFYNCSPTAVIRSNGALKDSANAFDIGDNVAIKFRLDDKGKKTNQIIISHLDGKKSCLKYLYLLSPFGGKYQIFALNIDQSMTQLTEDQAANKLNITLNQSEGFLFVAQGHPTKNQIYACLPNHGESRTSIDNFTLNFLTHQLKYSMWGDTDAFQGQHIDLSPVIGSDQDYEPTIDTYDFELSQSGSARHSYSVDKDGNLVDYGYSIVPVQLNPEKRYNILYGYITKTEFQYKIAYRNAKDNNAYYSNILFKDLGGQPWNPALDGTPDTWTIYMPIMAVAKDKLLIKSIEKTQITSGGGVAIGSLSGDASINEYYGSATATFNVDISSQTITTYNEKLQIGNIVIEDFTYQEIYSSLVGGSYTTLSSDGTVSIGVEIEGNYSGGLWLIGIVSRSWTISALGGFFAWSESDYANTNDLLIADGYLYGYGGSWTDTIIDNHIGDKDISVLAADTLQGDNNYIIIYSYGTRNYVGMYNSVPYGYDVNSIKPVTDNYTTTYKIAWQINGGGMNKSEITSWLSSQTYNCQDCTDIPSNVVELNNITTITGQKIDNVSVQINAGFISYTYCLYDFTNAVPRFIHRVVGVISISDNNYPIGEP